MSESSDHPEPVGSLADEAAKLLGALSGLAGERTGDLGETLSGFGEKVSDAAHDVDTHLATGGQDCVYCPVCRAIRVVRDADPEVVTHLAQAAASLVRAADRWLSTVAVEDRRTGAPGVERIDLDGDVAVDDGPEAGEPR